MKTVYVLVPAQTAIFTCTNCRMYWTANTNSHVQSLIVNLITPDFPDIIVFLLAKFDRIVNAVT